MKRGGLPVYEMQRPRQMNDQGWLRACEIYELVDRDEHE